MTLTKISNLNDNNEKGKIENQIPELMKSNNGIKSPDSEFKRKKRSFSMINIQQSQSPSEQTRLFIIRNKYNDQKNPIFDKKDKTYNVKYNNIIISM